MAKKTASKKKASAKSAAPTKSAVKKATKKAVAAALAPKAAKAKAAKTKPPKTKPDDKKAAGKKAVEKKSVASAAPAKTASKPAAKKARAPSAPIWQWTAVQTAAAIRSGAISAEEAVKAAIERMNAVNPRLNAVVVDLSAEALKAAKAADRARAKGADLPPMHGVPITIKENVDYQGRPNPNGVPALMGQIAPSDSPVVRNLKKAGAIVIGLTNTPEFSFRAFTDNPLHGLTLNPWDEAITCGGSSGGAGAAVAAGIGTMGHGNDIGGSLRWPAHCNGIVTIKPTQGRIPAYNESAPAERPMLAHLMSAQGPLTRTVADARLALAAMSQRDPRDPWWVPAPLEGPKPRGPIKVALAKIPSDMKVDVSVRAALTQAADDLQKSGYRVEEVEVPDISGVWRTWADVLTTEVVALQEAGMMAVTSDDFKIAWAGMRKGANILDREGFMRATADRNAHIRRWQMFFEDYPVILAPTTVQPTPGPREDTISEDRVLEFFRDEIRFISAINLLGLPGAVVPVSINKGRPIGVQLIAGRYREDLALAAAEAIEKRAGMLVRHLWEKMGA